MMAHIPNSDGHNFSINQTYGRRITHPFVPSINTSSSLIMSGLTSPENSGSSPLLSSSFPQHNMVNMSMGMGVGVGASVSAVPSSVQSNIVRSSPLVGYMDAMSLQHTQQQQMAPPHSHPSQISPGNSPYAQPLIADPHSFTPPQQHQHLQQHQQLGAAWLSEGDGGQNGSKTYSFVPLSGVNTKKRPRRRFDEIERLYVCNWAECEKAYGTLNHLNAHVSMQKHGPKRHPSEFKELRKAWRRQKKAEEEAVKQAAVFHQQQSHNQIQSQNQYQLCDPVLANMQGHPLALHPMSHHQPQQLPHPHPHPNQNLHHHQQHQYAQQQPQMHHHHQPMGF
ncbi:hypothetical protein BGX27_009439 [Mortierella sp. AM989]|nr:hypothetical protein BGX27_009439 [Mortierella sp. AM989]